MGGAPGALTAYCPLLCASHTCLTLPALRLLTAACKQLYCFFFYSTKVANKNLGSECKACAGACPIEWRGSFDAEGKGGGIDAKLM